MKEFYKKLHNGEITIGKNTQLTDNEWLAFAVYYEFCRFVDWQNMVYHLNQTIEGEEGSCSRIIIFYANWFYDKAHEQNDDTNKKKKFTLKSSRTRKLIKQYASDYLDFDIELDYEDLNEKTE